MNFPAVPTLMGYNASMPLIRFGKSSGGDTTTYQPPAKLMANTGDYFQPSMSSEGRYKS